MPQPIPDTDAEADIEYDARFRKLEPTVIKLLRDHKAPVLEESYGQSAVFVLADAFVWGMTDAEWLAASAKAVEKLPSGPQPDADPGRDY